MKKKLRKIVDFFSTLAAKTFNRRRISISDVDMQNEVRYIHISPIGMAMSILAILFIVFAAILAAVAYTPILDYLPGYRTDATKSREILMNNLIKIDSLERRMNDMITYNESIILVAGGKTPAMRTLPSDSLRKDKSIVATSVADSILRAEMETAGGRYTLNTTTSAPATHTNINAIAPMEGMIAEKFDIKSGRYGVSIAGAPEAQVVAIADGTVIAHDWSPERGNTIAIQHSGALVSFYRLLSSTMVEKGQRVRSGEVIGYTAPQGKGGEASIFEFELWGDGKPVDPETHIIF